MKLTIFNGSPKLGPNNTQLMIDALVKGFKTGLSSESITYKLNQLDSTSQAVEIFEKSEMLLIAFPLYSYAMPGNIMALFEALKPFKGKCSHKKLGFLVQYGFPEAVHARPLEKYLEKLATTLNCTYMGTIIKGGCDGLTKNPPSASAKIFKGIEEIGKTLATKGIFDTEELNAYAQPETSGKKNIWLMKITTFLINRLYWTPAMKKNGITAKQSFAKPYA